MTGQALRIYKRTNVYEEALTRIRWLFDEFPNVICTYSGGKDSTVIFHLCLEVAREKGRLPLKVMFLDQEAEWESTIEMVRSVMYHPDVEPKWYQIPMRLFNATSTTDHWLHCWEPGREDVWMHPQDPISIKENIYGTDRFADLFTAITTTEYPDTSTVTIGGVRSEESPVRYVGLTHWPSYKWATWGAVRNKRRGHYTMYPIYDWLLSDVWKAIHDNGWPYSSLYDTMYQYGTLIHEMRVSNVHHETAVRSLFFMQEVEPETWSRLTARLAGVDMAQKFGGEDYMPRTLPPMFGGWYEYRDYLLDKLIEGEDWKRKLGAWFKRIDQDIGNEERDGRAEVRAILLNDWEGITLNSYWVVHARDRVRRSRQRG